MAAARQAAVAEALKDDPDVLVGAATLLLGVSPFPQLDLPPEQYEVAVAMVNKALELRQIEQRNLAQTIAAYMPR